LVVVAALATSMLAPGRARADTTVFFDEAGVDVQTIGLIGDSTLSGVRWYQGYGELSRFNYVLDAESCRRTLATSCWSREDYRPETVIETMRRLSGEWGDLLVIMSGYNDASSGFASALDAVIEEAQMQGIPNVMWMALRTHEVIYEEPNKLANADTYREANRTLYAKAAELDGYLEIADWSTYTAERSSWFEGDGVHLTKAGAAGVTTFIMRQATELFAGRSITLSAAPWETIGPGDRGDQVAELQERLRDGGISTVRIVDGVYGDQTADGVRVAQFGFGLPQTGVVDVATAEALGLVQTAQPTRASSVTATGSTQPRAEAGAAVKAPSAVSSGSEASGNVEAVLPEQADLAIAVAQVPIPERAGEGASPFGLLRRAALLLLVLVIGFTLIVKLRRSTE